MSAHCDALPTEILPLLVDIQRLRDARLAQVAARALSDTGGPVVVITGNGHARKDWGIPVYLARIGIDDIVVLGQGEADFAPPVHGQCAAKILRADPPSGDFDLIDYSARAQRDDPCAAFAK